MGPGLPHHRAVGGGLRLRQGPAAADAAQPLQPSQRADAGLRVELQRREPAGPRLGDALPLQVREEPGPGGHPLPGALLPGADAQLQLVGQPQGPAGPATSSPAGSSASTTSASSTAARRSPPAGRWSRRTARPGWPSTARTCWRWPSSSPSTIRPTRRSRSSSSRTSSGSPTPWTRSASTATTCGTRRTASTTTSSACPSGEAFRLKVRSMVGLLPLCASTVFEEDVVARHPRLLELIALFRKRHPEVIAQVAPEVEGFKGYAGRRLLSPLTRTKLERILAYLLDENEFLSPYGIRALSRHHLDHPFVFSVAGAGALRRIPARGVEQRDVRRELQLARADLDAGQRADRPRPAEPLCLLRGRLQGRVPDRLREPDDPLRGREGDLAAPLEHLPARRERPPAGLRRLRRSSRTTRTGAT